MRTERHKHLPGARIWFRLGDSIHFHWNGELVKLTLFETRARSAKVILHAKKEVRFERVMEGDRDVPIQTTEGVLSRESRKDWQRSGRGVRPKERGEEASRASSESHEKTHDRNGSDDSNALHKACEEF